MTDTKKCTNVRLSADRLAVEIIDQTRLPNHAEQLRLETPEQFYDAIKLLKVRGAPAIGICAAYAMYVFSARTAVKSTAELLKQLEKDGAYLVSSRPTAVNLSWAVGRMLAVARENADKDVTAVISLMLMESVSIQQEDITMCRAISEYGLTLIKDGDGVLTHCNAGPLATSLYGTGLGTLFLAKEKGLTLHAYCDETRPLLQGARLTSYELFNAGIDVTLICDNMASIVMKQGKINACFVGCDRVAANGDTANKIGTSGVAVLAKHYGIPFYVFCPSSTIDFSCKSGDDITIEQREPDEIKQMFFAEPTAPEGVKCYNPSFDVTSAELITAIITERGICRYPYTKSLKALFGNKNKE